MNVYLVYRYWILNILEVCTMNVYLDRYWTLNIPIDLYLVHRYWILNIPIGFYTECLPSILDIGRSRRFVQWMSIHALVLHVYPWFFRKPIQRDARVIATFDQTHLSICLRQNTQTALFLQIHLITKCTSKKLHCHPLKRSIHYFNLYQPKQHFEHVLKLAHLASSSAFLDLTSI